MPFDVWIDLVAELLRREFPTLETLNRNPGVCFVVGISSADVIDARDGSARIVPHKDPMRMIGGQLRGRHMGKTLDRRSLTVGEASVRQAVAFLREHFTVESTEA